MRVNAKLALLLLAILLLFGGILSQTVEQCTQWNYVTRGGNFTLSRYAQFSGQKLDYIQKLNVGVASTKSEGSVAYVCGNYAGGSKINLNKQQTLSDSLHDNSFVAKFNNKTELIWGKNINSYISALFQCMDITAFRMEDDAFVLIGYFTGNVQIDGMKVSGNNAMAIIAYDKDGRAAWLRRLDPRQSLQSTPKVLADKSNNVIVYGRCFTEVRFQMEDGSDKSFACPTAEGGSYIGRYSRQGNFLNAKVFPGQFILSFAVESKIFMITKNLKSMSTVTVYSISENLETVYSMKMASFDAATLAVDETSDALFVAGNNSTMHSILRVSTMSNTTVWSKSYKRLDTIVASVIIDGTLLVFGQSALAKPSVEAINTTDGSELYNQGLGTAVIDDVIVDALQQTTFVVGRFEQGNELDGVPLQASSQKDGYLAVFKRQCSCQNSDCLIPVCGGQPAYAYGTCAGRGRCVAANTCACAAGFGGENCEFPVCGGKLAIDATVCNGRGTCIAPDRCECEPNYSGYLCNTTTCFDIVASSPSVCSGFGVCISKDNCKCAAEKNGGECTMDVQYTDRSPICQFPDRKEPTSVMLESPQVDAVIYVSSVRPLPKTPIEYTRNRILVTNNGSLIVTASNLLSFATNISTLTSIAKLQYDLRHLSDSSEMRNVSALWTLDTTIRMSISSVKENEYGDIFYAGADSGISTSYATGIVGKLRSDGQLVWERRLSASVMHTIELQDSDIIVSGTFLGLLQIDECRALGKSLATRAFIIKLDGETGTCVFIEQGGGLEGEGMATIQQDVLLTGSFMQYASFQTFTLSTGKNSGYLIRYNLRKIPKVVWARVTATSTLQLANEYVRTDANENIVAAGTFSRQIVADGHYAVARGANDVFVQQFDSNGNLRWMRTIGTSDVDTLSALQVDASTGSIYLLVAISEPVFYVDNQMFNLNETSADPNSITKTLLVSFSPHGRLIFWKLFADPNYHVLGNDLYVKTVDASGPHQDGKIIEHLGKNVITVYAMYDKYDTGSGSKSFFHIFQLSDSWCEYHTETERKESKDLMIILISSSAAAATIIALVAIFILAAVLIRRHKLRREKSTDDEDLQEELLGGSQPGFKIDTSMFIIRYKDLSAFEEIGAGASGAIVFKAKLRGETVAVKVFRKTHVLSNSETYEEFEHEVKLLASVRHNNVLNFYGAFLGSKVGFVTEFCGRGSLADLIQKEAGQLSLQRKLKMLFEICLGMNYLHSRNIIHRDLKSANVLVDMNYVCKVADFGLSKMVDKFAKTHQLTTRIGTSVYMSPEVTLGGVYNNKCDVFSFAIIMHEVYYEQSDVYANSVRDGSSSMFNIEIKVAQDPTFRPLLKEESNTEMMWFFELMKRCWSHEPENRPSFDQIIAEFETNM